MMACKLLPIGSVRYCLAPPLRFRVQSFNDWSATSSHVKLRISLTLAPVSSSVLSKSACHGFATARTLLMSSGVGTYLTYCSTAGLVTKRQGFRGTASLCQFQSAFNVRMRRSAALPPRSASVERIKLVAITGCRGLYEREPLVSVYIVGMIDNCNCLLDALDALDAGNAARYLKCDFVRGVFDLHDGWDRAVPTLCNADIAVSLTECEGGASAPPSEIDQTRIEASLMVLSLQEEARIKNSQELIQLLRELQRSTSQAAREIGTAAHQVRDYPVEVLNQHRARME